MDQTAENFRKRLKQAGLSDSAIAAAWPAWWSDEASNSPSARAELQFSVARKLGISPKSLYDDHVDFIWRDEARFKHLAAKDQSQKAALASYGMTLGRLLAPSIGAPSREGTIPASVLRTSILRSNDYVDLPALVSSCWALGIPVIHLRVFPLSMKAMHAMVVRAGERHIILIGRDASYPAPIAFTLAHELGHIAENHLSQSEAIIDIEDPATDHEGDDREEKEADRYALELLTGRPDPVFQTNAYSFSGRQLANSVAEVGPKYRISAILL